MTESNLFYWPLLILLSVLLYALPGIAALKLFRLTGIGRVAQCLLSIPVSLVLIPVALVIVSNFIPFLPMYWMVVLMTILLWVVGVFLDRKQKKPSLQFRSRVFPSKKPSPREWILIGGAILLFSLLVNLPRIEMFVHGDQSLAAATWDEYWHLSEVISVARTGIPPLHYFYPEVPLIYYYFSWITPATLVNQPILNIPIARALALHSFLQVISFLGLAYYLLRQNFKRTTSRVFGLASFTILGGLDYFTTLNQNEWWQKDVDWLTSNNQISSFVTLYAWVPQHLAGGMAFLLALLLWRNVRCSTVIRISFLGILLGFTFGTSVFVCIAFVVAIMVGLWIYRKKLFRKKNIRWSLLFLCILLIIDWHQVLLTLSHPGTIGISNFRIPLLEKYFNSASEKIEWADGLLTIGLLPLFGSIILFIEIGVGYAMYLIWSLWKGWRSTLTWQKFLFLYPILFYLLSCIITDDRGGGNFTMRGMIPAQIAIVFAATLFLESIRFPKQWAPRLVLAYLCFVVVFCQSISWVIDLQAMIRTPLGDALGTTNKIKLFGINFASSIQWPESLEYIHWLNKNTPNNALIIEEDLPASDDLRFRMLERIRFMDPKKVELLLYAYHDNDLLSPIALDELEARISQSSLLDVARQSSYAKRTSAEIYYVTREGAHPEFGEPVFTDHFVTIYRILQ